MLKEVICSKFKEKRVEFHEGLNVVLGDDCGSNSIGKSTFLMIIDFVFGGKDYVMKSDDIQRKVGVHIINFAFKFDEKMYYFSRSTGEMEYVNVCDEQYNIVDRISIEQYTNKLKKLYKIPIEGISFRDVVGRYSRIAGKENLEEKKPLDVARKEKAGQAINALLKLWGLYGAIKELEDLAQDKKDALNAFKGAQKYNFISNIGSRQRHANDKMLVELEKEIHSLTEELNSNLLDFDSEKAELVLELKRELADYNGRIRRQKYKLMPLEDGLRGKRPIKADELNALKTFFPEINLKQLFEIQSFHEEIDCVLRQEIAEEISNIESMIQVLQQSKMQIEDKIREISNASNLSQVILFKYAEIQKKIDRLRSQNEFYDKKVVLENERRDVEMRKKELRVQQLTQLENMVNVKMSELNDVIYRGEKVPPTLKFIGNQYIFKTVDDTGTGTCYRGLVLYDLSILDSTCLPILIHDSVLLKQIEDIAIEKILEMYNDSEKQIFIALDKATSYSKRSQDILKQNRVLELEANGKELFGWSWSRQ